MTNITVRVLTVGIIYIVTSCLSSLSFLKSRRESAIIKMHPIFLVIGIVGSVIFGCISILLAVFNHDTVSLILLGFLILTVPLIIAYFQCRFFYTDTQIVARSFWGGKKTILFSDIKQIDRGLDVILKSESFTLTMPSYFVGVDAFLSVLRKANPKLNKKIRKKKTVPPVRPFREAVWRPGEFIFVYILMFVICLFYCWLIWYAEGKHFTKFFWLPVGCLICWGIITFLSIHSAKRAHASAFWAAVAKKFFKEGYLNDF